MTSRNSAALGTGTRRYRLAEYQAHLACEGDKATYKAAFQSGTKVATSDLRVLAGNSITLVADQGATATSLSITNSSRNWTITKKTSYVDDETFPIILDELDQFKGQSGAAQVPVFNEMVFTRTYANGDSLASYPFTADNLVTDHVLRIATDNSTPASDTGLTFKFEHI